MRRAVVVWLCDTEAIRAQILTLQFGGCAVPDAALIPLRLGNGGVIPFAVLVTGFDIAVIFGRASDGQEDAHIAALLCDKLHASHTRH